MPRRAAFCKSSILVVTPIASRCLERLGVAAPSAPTRDAEWLTDVRDEISQCSAQQDVKISQVDVRRQLKKVANWKGSGPDGVQGYWLKSFTALHGRVVLQLNEVLESDSVPQWLNKGRTILCPKDPTTPYILL